MGSYSLGYAITTLLGCTVFLEYWKLQEADLSIRWDVKGVGSLKVNRPGYKYEKVVVDAAGRTKHIYPKWKAILRQLLQFPFFAVALVFLGAVITAIYALEVIISEVYQGPHQWMLVCCPDGKRGQRAHSSDERKSLTRLSGIRSDHAPCCLLALYQRVPGGRGDGVGRL